MASSLIGHVDVLMSRFSPTLATFANASGIFFKPHTGETRWMAVAGLFLGIQLVYVVGLAIYRLYLSPIAKFPGPKLAAVTGWYETYYDLFHQGGGKFTHKIKEIHQKYGPIVRINPWDLHIDDPQYYDTIYTMAKPYDKLVRHQHRLNIPEAAFSTADSVLHKRRRNAAAPFFSKQKMREQADVIQGFVDRLSYRLKKDFAGTGRVIDMTDMWGCQTSDAITELVFARPTNALDSADLMPELSHAMTDMVFSAHWMTHFPWLLTIMNLFPKRLVKILAPPYKSVLGFQEEMERQISDLLTGRNREVEKVSHKTLFNELLRSDLPAEDLTLHRLQNEAVSVVAAGDHTTKSVFALGSVHVLANPDIQAKLLSELRGAIPDPSNMPPWYELEKLPYLNAVVAESLRMALGLVQRLTRINKFEAWRYGEYEIPPGTPVGMDSFHMHTNPDIFPEPDRFRPERWLGNPRAPDGKPLSNYMITFSKGTRMCLGMYMVCPIFSALCSFLLFRATDN